MRKEILALLERGGKLTTAEIALRLENLSMHFGGLKAVDSLSFDVLKG